MTTIAFDTLAYVKRLRDAGFTEPQAETLAQTQAELIDSQFANKQDLKKLEVTLKRDIELLRAEMKQSLAETKAEIIRWTVGAGVLQTALIAALLLKLVH